MIGSSPSALPHQKLAAIFDARLQTLTTTHRYFRVTAHRFLSYLQTDFPQVFCLSQLRRDPHLLGWLRCLGEEDPPLSQSTRRVYLVGLRRLLRDSASESDPLQPGLILPEDFPVQPRFPRQLLRTSDRLPHLLFGEIFDARIQTLATTLRPSTTDRFRGVVCHFLTYLQTDFPQVRQLSELHRDPHLLGWLHRLYEQDPPWSNATRQKYLRTLRRLLHDLASEGYPLQPGLILPKDFPSPPRFPQQIRRTRDRLPHLLFGEIFDARIQTLTTTLRPSTIHHYRGVVCHFLTYLQTDFPQVRQLSELRRNPHLLGWFRRLCEQDPTLSNATRQDYLLNLRRLLHDLASEGHPLQPGLILPEDFPRLSQYLPRALSPEVDRQLQQELRHTNDLLANALLLTRATGIRIGECVHLALDCLRSLGQNQWALHVPVGKLYTERLVPLDEDVRQIVTRILTLRAEAPTSQLVKSEGFLLPRSGNFNVLYRHLRLALHRAAGQVGCSHRILCHQLRHTYATEMIRLGVSLPALMQLLGHTDIRMTMRYVQVTQRDLQREFHLARQNAVKHHQIPELAVSSPFSANSDLLGIRRSLAATRYLLEMYRRQLQDEKVSRKLQRLDKRLLNVAFELDRFGTPEK